MLPQAPTVTIRQIRSEDAPALFSLIQDQGHRLDAFAWREGLKSLKDEIAFVLWSQAAWREGSVFNWVIEADGQLCGCVSLYRPHLGAFPEGPERPWQAGYWVDKALSGLGIASKALTLACFELAQSHAFFVGIDR